MPSPISVLTYAVNAARRNLGLCDSDAEAARLRSIYEAALAARRACPVYQEYQRRNHAKAAAQRAHKRDEWWRLVISAGHGDDEARRNARNRAQRKRDRAAQGITSRDVRRARSEIAAEQRAQRDVVRRADRARKLDDKRRLGLLP